MKKLWLSGFIVVVLYQLSMAQTINGVVKSEGNGQPIALANIGMLNSKMGTYSGDDGSFSLEFSQDLENAVLVISAIGFEGKRISVKDVDMTNELEIMLTSKNYELGEFTVEDSRIRGNTIGNPWLPLVTNRMAWSAGLSSTRVGKTIAIKIEIKHEPPIRLDEVSVGVFENPWKEAEFRVRILNVDLSGMPGEDMINLKKTSVMTEEVGWVNFNFEEKPPRIKY